MCVCAAAAAAAVCGWIGWCVPCGTALSVWAVGGGEQDVLRKRGLGRTEVPL